MVKTREEIAEALAGNPFEGLPLERVFYSVLAAVVMGVFLWISHRPGRYVGG